MNSNENIKRITESKLNYTINKGVQKLSKIKNMNRKEFITHLKKTNKQLKNSKKNSEILYSWICRRLLYDIENITEMK